MDYAIGDIHGCLDKVLRLLEVLHYDPTTDRLIFLGDYIDRGPDSKGVLDLMLGLQRENPANVFLMGNHEDNLLTYIHACMPDDGALAWHAGAPAWHDSSSAWRSEPFFAGGGVMTLASYAPHLRDPYDPHLCHAIPLEHRQWLAALPLCWRSETYIAVHAGVRPGIPLERQHTNDLLRIRSPFLTTPHGLGKCVVFGHTPFREVKREADKVGIDTGACYAHLGYGKLTAFCLQTQQTFQVE